MHFLPVMFNLIVSTTKLCCVSNISEFVLKLDKHCQPNYILSFGVTFDELLQLHPCCVTVAAERVLHLS
jgi:hypothetical protein